MSSSDAEEDRTQVFLELLAEHERAIRVYVIAMVASMTEAEEILQDTRLAMWKHFDSFEEGSNFRAWGRKIAYHRILALRTNKSREKRRRELSEKFYERLNEATEEVLEENREARVLQDCLGKLRSGHREIIRRRYHDEETVEEIAQAMGRTVAATYRVISRIRESLRKCVHEQKLSPQA